MDEQGVKEVELLLHDLGIRYPHLVVSVTPRPRFSPGERTPGTHCTRGFCEFLRESHSPRPHGHVKLYEAEARVHNIYLKESTITKTPWLMLFNEIIAV
jgi:hypothetical protein